MFRASQSVTKAGSRYRSWRCFAMVNGWRVVAMLVSSIHLVPDMAQHALQRDARRLKSQPILARLSFGYAEDKYFGYVELLFAKMEPKNRSGRAKVYHSLPMHSSETLCSVHKLRLLFVFWHSFALELLGTDSRGITGQ